LARKKNNRIKGSGSLYLRGTTWWMAWQDGTSGFRESTGKQTKGEAQTVLTARIADYQRGVITTGSTKTTVEDLVALVIKDYEQNLKKTPIGDLQSRWTLHLKPVFGGRRAASVTAGLIAQYVDKRLAEKAPNATINRELALLRRGFNIGKQRGKVTTVPAFTMLKEPKAREGFLSAEQYQALAAACSAQQDAPWLRGFFETAGQLANRKGELLEMRVRDVDFTRGLFTLPDTKNGEPRTVPMMANVRSLIAAQCEGKSPDDYVFTWPDGNPVRDFRELWAKVTKAAGVEGLKVHDLRRTGVRNLIRAGVDEHTAMRISGHKTREVFRRYNIIDDRDLQAAVQRAGEFRSRFTDFVQPAEKEESKIM
jgi:integrase